jgi:plastocyanin
LQTLLQMTVVPAALLLAACRQPAAKPGPVEYFHVDATAAGTVSGRVTFRGISPKPKRIMMNSDAGCPAEGHEETVVTGKGGGLANAFVYIQSGLEGKRFEPPGEAAVLDQRGCMYSPRVLGMRAGQRLVVRNSDQVSHNVHPMPANNRDWNQQQSPQAPDLEHRFPRSEVMIPVKCNVHSWMHAYIGVLDHPYFAVTGAAGDFEFRNVPSGDYMLAAWHETLGELKQPLHVAPSGKAAVELSYR